MLYSCTLLCFLCASGCLLTISLFSERWLLVEVSLKNTPKVQVTTFVTVGLWETKRIRYYHFRHHHAAIFIYHDYMVSESGSDINFHPKRSSAAPATTTTSQPSLTTTTTTAATAAVASTTASGKGISKQLLLYKSQMSEQALLRLSTENFGPLVAIRVLLFLADGLALTSLLMLLLFACNDTSVIRHRYKERRLSYSLIALCSLALILSVISWAIFLGTVHADVLRAGESSGTLNAGFVCCVLSSVSLLVSVVMVICSAIE